MSDALEALMAAGIVQIVPVGFNEKEKEKEHTNCAYCEAGVGEAHQEEAGE